MKASIGILAYNEAPTIPRALESLFRQTLITEMPPTTSLEIIVVANGCTDGTAQVSQNCLERCLASMPGATQITTLVKELDQPGKSNAWNVYVHGLSDPACDFLFLMDGDIELIAPNTLRSMLTLLLGRPEAWVAVDRPIKDVLFKQKKNLMDRASLLISQLSGGQRIEGKPSWLCGQLYCGRSQPLRRLHLPTQLPAQDGFLYHMLTTDGLREAPKPERIILAPDACHRFEAYTQIGQLLRHEKWLILATTVNEILYGTLPQQRSSPLEHIGQTIQRLNQSDPDWLSQWIGKTIAQRRFWLIPPFILTRRFYSLRHKALPKAIAFLPFALAAFCVDFMLAIQANTALHKGQGFHHWRK